MSSSGNDKMTIRYAPYIEAHHSNFLDTIVSHQKITINDSPYASYNTVSIEDAFLGSGYIISSFPSLWDMFGKFMSGFDVDSLYKKFFDDDLKVSELKDAVTAEGDLIDLEVLSNLMPKFLKNMRNINAVISSSFVVGKSCIEACRVRALAQFSAALKYQLLPLVSRRWTAYLNFKKTCIVDQAFAMKLYFSLKMYIDEVNYDKALKDKLWPFTVLEYERMALAAMRNTKAVEKEKAERSGLSKCLLVASYTMQGAIIGSYFPPYGTYIGAVIGFVVGLAMVLIE